MKENKLRLLREIEKEVKSVNIYRRKKKHKYLPTVLDTVHDTCTDYSLETEFCKGGEIPYLTGTFRNFGNE